MDMTVYFTAAALYCVLQLHRVLIRAVGIYDSVPSRAVLVMLLETPAAGKC